MPPFSRFTFGTSVLITSIFIATALSQASDRPEKISIRVGEGTELAFDVSPDGRSIVFDLLGQLWILPAAGGSARPVTDAVLDIADDRDPSFSPDGRRVVFRGERNGRTGLWLLNLGEKVPRQLTQLSDPQGYDGHAAWSPDGRFIAYAHAVPPTSAGTRWRRAIFLYDAASGTTRELEIKGIANPQVGDPVWLGTSSEIAFVAYAQQSTDGRIWRVSSAGGEAVPLTEESVRGKAPASTPDGRLIAYFAPDSDGRTQIWTLQIGGGAPLQVTNHADVTPTRIRFIPGGDSLLYSADGRLWTVAPTGGKPREIRFTASLSIIRPRDTAVAARFPEPGKQQHARGFMGLALSPDGQRIGMLALGKLWIIPIGGNPRSVAAVPLSASSLAWRPDGNEVAFSAGPLDNRDLFATDLRTGTTRQITDLPGRAAYPAYSPDGRHLAFVHSEKETTLRVSDPAAGKITDLGQTQNLGAIRSNWTSPPQWSPPSDGLVVSGGANPAQASQATFFPLSGRPQPMTRFPNAPIFLQWTQQDRILFVRHDRLWEAGFDRTGMLSEPKPIGTDAALYASSSRDGTVLFVSDGGLRVRSSNGKEQKLGWPITYTPAVPEPTLIRNVRIIDGTGRPMTAPRDILIQQGRIARIAAAGSLADAGARAIDAAGRVIMPGLMDLHAHNYRPDLLPGFLYFGVTTVRDQGTSMAPLVGHADAIAAGVLAGPRVGYGGFQFYSDWGFDQEEWRGIEPEADPDHVRRSVALADAFGAQHIKTRTFRRWDINARMIREAHRRGMRATGHCSHLLPLVAAGMDAKEHFGTCESRGNTHMYDDLIQLFRAARIGVVPTITYFDFAVRVNQRPALLEEDPELVPFTPSRDNFGWMISLSPDDRKSWAQDAELARKATVRLLRAGVTIGTGTDIWQIPTGAHMELEQLVAAGMTPIEAIHAGTGGAARILGAERDLGTIEIGKWADLVILDADPTADIRNTRRIWKILQAGRIVDRSAILKSFRP